MRPRPGRGNAAFSGTIVSLRSKSGERRGVRAAFSTADFLEAIFLRALGATAPVTAAARGARPFLGRVLAWRCFLPSRFFSFLGAMTSSISCRESARAFWADGLSLFRLPFGTERCGDC